MYLIDAIQRGLVVEPKIVSFDFMLRETDEYEEILEMIEHEEDETKKKQLIEIKNQIDDLISGDTDIIEHVKNNISQKENQEIGRIIKETIKKKNGRYIVFLPQHTHGDGLTEIQYFDKQEQKIREILSEIDAEPEVSRLSSAYSKAENHRAITDFEYSSSEHLKIMLAINKLNEGVHVDSINGEIMYRRINDGSVILYLQQLGRVIYALDPNEQIADEDIPIVYDIYNNYLIQNLNRTINQTTPKSDLQKLQEVIAWMDKHGYELDELDINSEDIRVAKKAITLKKIQKKYKKYKNGINNPRLSKSDIYEIEQIMELAYSIDLFDKEFGERIIPPGEKDFSEVQLFKISATQKKFSELYKKANKVLDNPERHKNRPTAKLNYIINALEILNENDIFIDNNLIRYRDTLKDVIDRYPEEMRQILLEELSDYDEEYPIGKEYNFAKSSFRDSSIWRYFENADVRKLYSCGIFEDVDKDYLIENVADDKKRERLKRNVLMDDFIIIGNKSLKGLNVKTGTYFDEDGKICELFKEIDKEEQEFESIVEYIRKVQSHIMKGYSLANESIDEIEDLRARECVVLYRDIDDNTDKKQYYVIPDKFYLKKGILQAREYLQERQTDLEKQQIIEYKKLGILPLNIDKNGIDVETGLPREYFGKSVKEIEKEKEKEIQKRQLKKLKEILTISTYRYKVCTANIRLEDLPNEYFKTYVMRHRDKETAPTEYKFIPAGFELKEEIKKARIYLQQMMDNLSIEEIIEYKKIGILPLNIDENGIDIDTNLHKTNFEFTSVDLHGFDKDGYYCIRQDDGTYISTGLKYTPAGFDKNMIHVVTEKSIDLRGFDFFGNCKRNDRKKYDKNGFLQDGTHKDTGELYYEGYNCYGIDENGKDKQGKFPKEITFVRDYIGCINGKGDLKEIYKKYGINNSYELKLILYKAGEMWPKIKILFCQQIDKYQKMIKQREEKLKQLEEQKSEDAQLIGKLQKQNAILRDRIRVMNPMQDFDK